MTKIQAMREMEKAGLSFTANVLMNGCSKPTAKMQVILKLLASGLSVSHAPYETCAIVVNGRLFWLGALDAGFDSCYSKALAAS